MKKFIVFGLLLNAFLLSANSKQRAFQTECATLESNGYISINIWNSQKPLKYKLKHAQKDAIYALLFSGVAASSKCVSQPSILMTNDDRLNFEKIEKRFFSRWGRWKMFVRSSSVKTPQDAIQSNRLIYTISISKNDLRKYLEENKIIKSLNTGF